MSKNSRFGVRNLVGSSQYAYFSCPPIKRTVSAFNDTRQCPTTRRGKSGPGLEPFNSINSVDFVSMFPPVSHKVLPFKTILYAREYLGGFSITLASTVLLVMVKHSTGDETLLQLQIRAMLL
jgi:hypothetical protein